MNSVCLSSIIHRIKKHRDNQVIRTKGDFMKNQKIFPGIILIGFGLYFYFQQHPSALLKDYMSWPALLMIVGLAFLAQGYGAKDYEAILPGVILFGFGFHFQVVHKISVWPNNICIFILIISLGFLLRYQKTRTGFFQGALFLVLSIILLFYDKILHNLGTFETKVSSIWNIWPIILVAIGLLLLVFKKK